MPPIKLAGASQAERLALGKQVREYRLAMRFTQAQLAEAADVTRKTISNMENGTFAPQEDVLRRVFTILGVPTESNAFQPDVEQYLGMLGGMLEQIPKHRRLVIVNRITAMLMSEAISDVGGSDDAVVTPFAAGDDETHEQLDPDTV